MLPCPIAPYYPATLHAPRSTLHALTALGSAGIFELFAHVYDGMNTQAAWLGSCDAMAARLDPAARLILDLGFCSRSPSGGLTAAATASSTRRAWHARSERLQFQLLLAPIFLWGAWLADGRPAGRFWLAFAIFHVCLYGGATAYNSAYDRDEGPVGGLERPPPVHGGLLPLSLLVLAVGQTLALLVNGPFAAVYLAIWLLALAYSRPRVRWKARPSTSILTIFVGQGLLGFAGGWLAVRPDLSSLVAWPAVLGAFAAACIVLGFYPLTQLFRIEEDRARGDRTLAVAWGAGPCFRLAQAGFAAGGLLVGLLLVGRGPAAEPFLAGLFFALLITAVERWRRRFDPAEVLPNFHRAMRLNALAAACLAGFVALHWLLD